MCRSISISMLCEQLQQWSHHSHTVLQPELSGSTVSVTRLPAETATRLRNSKFAL